MNTQKTAQEISRKLSSAKHRAADWLRTPFAHRAAIEDLRAAYISRDYRRLRKPAEYLLWLVAIVSLGYCTAQYSAAALHQSRQNSLLDSMRSRETSLPGDGAPASMNSALPNGATRVAATNNPPLGRIEIPRIGVSAIVEEGDADPTLLDAVGHIPGTALPGADGNAALAGHRDTYFRHLEDVQDGDEIWFTTMTAIYKYRVESTRVVDPSDVSVLASTGHPQLTLVTCYPFHYVGPAPKRFIVVAVPE